MCKYITSLLLFWLITLSAIASYPILGETEKESLEIATDIIAGYFGEDSAAVVTASRISYPRDKFLKRALMSETYSKERVQMFLKSGRLSINKCSNQEYNCYCIEIDKRPDIKVQITVNYPNNPKLDLLQRILPVDVPILYDEKEPTNTEIVAAFNLCVDIASVPSPKRTFFLRLPNDWYIGEKEWAKRIALACNSLEWTCVAFHFQHPRISQHSDIIKSSLCTALHNKLINKLNPDFLIGLFYLMDFVPCNAKNQFLYLTEMPSSFRDEEGNLTRIGRIALNYNGLIDSNPDHQWLKKLLVQKGKESTRVLSGYPSTHITSFKEPTFNGIFYCGANWDDGRSSEESKLLFKNLEKTGLMHVFGPPNSWQHLNDSYKGFIPFDGVTMLEKIHECGVGLCIHWSHHLEAGIPMSRFFEICAAGGLAICDDHPWLREHFGDVALFFNHRKPWQERLSEIIAHFEWIKANREKAVEMARLAHKRFVEKYAIQVTLKEMERVCFSK